MNFFSSMWMKLTGLFREANLKPLDPVPVHIDVPADAEVVSLSDEVVEHLTALPPEADVHQLTENFHIDEFACHDGTPVPVELYGNVLELAHNLQILRDTIGKPIRVMSGYRDPVYNAKIGGARKSKHMEAMAADIRVKGISPATLANKVEALIKEGTMKAGGLGRYPTFTHYDVRGRNARWRGTRKKN